MTETLAKYGWTIEENIVYNRKDNPVVVIKYTKKGYQFYDALGNLLMSGRGQIEISIEKLLKDYYYCQPIN